MVNQNLLTFNRNYYYYKRKRYYFFSYPIESGWYGTLSGVALPAVHVVHQLKKSSDLTRSTGNPERMKDPRWRTVIWRKLQSDAHSPKLRYKLKFIKIICLNKIWHRWAHAQSFLIILFWQLSALASQWWRARSQPDSLACHSGLFWWLSGVCGWVLGSQLRLSKAETFPRFKFAEF